MIHKKIIKEFIQLHTTNWIEEDKELIKENFGRDFQKITLDLANSISQICQQGSHLQGEGYKGAAAYLCISLLHTNLLENIWKYRLDLYDEMLYFDNKECTATWEPKIIWDCFEKHLAELQIAAHTGIYTNKIRSYHLAEIKVMMAEQYHIATMALAQQIIKEAIQTLAYQNLLKIPDFQISIGEYMDECMVIYQQQDVIPKIKIGE